MTLAAWIAAHPRHYLARLTWRRGWTWVLVEEKTGGMVVWGDG